MAAIASTSDSTFETDVLQSDLPVIVDFGAEWCHPCKQLDPIVEELAGDPVVDIPLDVAPPLRADCVTHELAPLGLGVGRPIPRRGRIVQQRPQTRALQPRRWV